MKQISIDQTPLSPLDDAAQLVGMVPHRLLDGYDADGAAPSQEFIEDLLASAPGYIKQRLSEVQAQKKLEST